MTRNDTFSLSSFPLGRASVDLIDEYLADTEAAATTKIKRRAHLIELAAWLQHPLANHPRGESACEIDYASAGQLHRFMSYLMCGERFAGSQRSMSEPLSASSRKGFLASIRSFYRHLVVVRVIDRDPTIGIRSPKVTHHPGFRLTQAEVHRLLEASGTPRDRIQTYLLVYTAARACELRALRWDDIDFQARLLTLHGKGDTTHLVNIHPALMGELRRWFIIQEQIAERHPALAHARASAHTNYVLMSIHGRPLPHTAIYKQLKRRAVRANLHVLQSAHGECRSLVSPHAIRRSIATLLLNDGHPLDAVADVLHHRQLDTTRTHYAFSSPERRRATIEAILR